MEKHIASPHLAQQNTLNCIVKKGDAVGWQISCLPEGPAQQIMFHPGDSPVESEKLEGKHHTEDQSKANSQDWPARETSNIAEGQSACESTDQAAKRSKEAGGETSVLQ